MEKLMDLNKTKRSESMRKLPLDKHKIPEFILSKRPRDNPLTLFIDEIIQHLIQIIEVLLQQENSKNYISFMNKTQEMIQESQKKMINTLSQKVIELRSQIILQNGKKSAKVPLQEKNSQFNILKIQRKMMTENLISFHRTNSFSSGKQRSEENHIQSDKAAQQECLEINSLQLNSINHKLSVIEEQNSKNLKDLYKKLELKIEENYKDIRLLTQKNLSFRLNFQERLDVGLQSVWNVIGDTQTKLCSFQQLLNSLCSHIQ